MLSTAKGGGGDRGGDGGDWVAGADDEGRAGGVGLAVLFVVVQWFGVSICLVSSGPQLLGIGERYVTLMNQCSMSMIVIGNL